MPLGSENARAALLFAIGALVLVALLTLIKVDASPTSATVTVGGYNYSVLLATNLQTNRQRIY